MRAAHKLTNSAEALTGLIYKAQMQARTLHSAARPDHDLSADDFADMILGASELLENLLEEAGGHADALCADIFATHPVVRAARRSSARVEAGS